MNRPSTDRLNLAQIVAADDPRELPCYTIPEAAKHLRMPPATLRSWVRGRNYPTSSGLRRFKPLVELPDPNRPLLSFLNLAEAHVLSACRRRYQVPLPSIRRALNYIAKELNSEHPLLESEFETDGVGLFVTKLGQLIDATAQGQVVMRELVEQHLQRLDRESDGVIRFYPFTRPLDASSPKSVYIDPRISYGQPVLASNHIPTAAFVERYRAGESIAHLADDYGCKPEDVEEAIRCELAAAA